MTPAGDAPAGELDPLGVLGWPAFSNRAEQPYNGLLYSHLRELGVRVDEHRISRVLSGRYSILHLHWPDRRVRDPSVVGAVARSAGLLALLDVARARGVRIVWTVHNLEAHEGTYRPWLETRYWQGLIRRVDGFISLFESGLSIIRERFPSLRKRPGFAVPHGHLRNVYPDDVDRAEARRTLGLPPDSRVVAFVGQVRPYKNVLGLIRAFRQLPEPDGRLLVAGRPKPAELARGLRAAAENDPRIRLDLRFIPDDELHLYLRAADLVALPYRDVLNSSSALLGLSFDRPVLVPNIGGMPDLARSVGEAWVRTYAGDLTPAELNGALGWAAAGARPDRAPLEHLGWDRVARLTLEAYQAVLEASRR